MRRLVEIGPLTYSIQMDMKFHSYASSRITGVRNQVVCRLTAPTDISISGRLVITLLAL